jgi:hypothetical protein
MAQPKDESFFSRLTRLFRSGPSIRRKIKGYDDTGYYDKQAALANKSGMGALPFRRGSSQNSPFNMLGGADMMSRMTRYMEFAEMEYCLHGDTKIAVPNGYKTLKQLSEEHGPDGEFLVYSYDHNTRSITPAVGKAARKTRTDHAWKVTFDNGKEIIGTSDHRLMLRDGTYRTISELCVGDAMMPFLRKDLLSEDRKDEGDGYRYIYTMNRQQSKSGWLSEHRLIASWVAGRDLLDSEVIHHKNFVRWDNRPENLEIMDEREHQKLHAVILNGKKWSQESNEDWIAKFKQRHSEWMKVNNPSERKDITFDRILQWCSKHGFNGRRVAQAFDSDQNTIKRKLHAKGFQDFATFAKAYNPTWRNVGEYQKGHVSSRRADVGFQDVCSVYRAGFTLKQVAKKLGTSTMIPLSRIKEQGYESWTQFTKLYNNCKVQSIEYYGHIDLYDLTVDGYKNFATDSIISHNTPIISKALDVQADEACSGDENGKNFHIYSDNARVKETLEELFYDILNVDFNLRVWIRNLIKYGDFFLYNEVAPGVGVVNVMAMNVNEVERDEGFDSNDPYAVRFKWHKMGTKELENWQVTHFRILGNDRFNPYGTSILEAARRIWRQYVMMLDAMLVYRLVRSPERRVFYVDVGTVAPNDIPNYMQTVMATIRGNMAVDKANGRMDERFNPTDVLEDYVVPVRGANSGTKIDTLSGGTNATAIEDIQIIESQLFAALGVPKAYLGYDDMLSSKATLAQEDIRFSRTIQILQKIVIAELNKLAILHLYAKGFDGEDLIDFELRLSNPSTVALQQKLDLWKTKIDIVGAVDNIETRFLPMNWLYKEILGFTEDEVAGIKEQLKNDRKFAVELDSINTPEDLGENTVDPFDGTSYIPLGGLPKNLPNNPSNTAQRPSSGGTAVPELDNSNPMNFSLSDQQAPIKDNPQVRMDRRNQERRRSSLQMQSNQPDFRRMLNPGKNKSLSDIYDTEFLKNPLTEAIKRDLRKGTTKEAYLSKEMKSMLERFDRQKRALTNEIPGSIELLRETPEVDLDTALDQLLMETEERPKNSNSQLKELAELGLDLKESNTLYSEESSS